MQNTYIGKDYYTFNNPNEYLLDNTPTVEEITLNRLIQHYDKLKNKFIYHIKLTKTPNRTDYHSFSFDKLSDVSRKLTNGLAAFGRMPNRDFWKRNFLAGIRTVSINQFEFDDYPTFSLNYIVFSEFDNLDILLKKQIGIRLKLIDSTYESQIEYLGQFDKQKVLENLNYHTQVNDEASGFKKMGENNINSIFENQFQRPHFLGILFKTI
jgi:hypothetical protein